MIAICGAYGYKDDQAVIRMLQALKHRGPGSAAIYRDQGLTIGAREIEPVPVKDCFFPSNASGTIKVAASGSIFNADELRQSLKDRNYRFLTNRDAEVIAHMYEEYDIDFLSKLNGMFSIALWDKNKQRLLLARDCLGEKPLYYIHKQNTLLFASELKALLATGFLDRSLSLKALDHYLSFRSIPAPFTAYKDARSLQPGECLIVEKNKVRIFQYTCLTYNTNHSNINNSRDLTDQLLSLLEESIRLRLNSEAPVGLLLSGGIDSGILAALLKTVIDKPVVSFTLGFEVPNGFWKFDERNKARQLAEKLGTEHHEEIIHIGSIKNYIPRFLWAIDQPTGDGLHHYILYKIAREHVSMVLTGTGADEIFAGYHWFHIIQKMSKLDSWLKFLGPAGRNMLAKTTHWSYRASAILDSYGSIIQKFGFTNTLFNEHEKKQLLTEDIYQEIIDSRDHDPVERLEVFKEELHNLDPINAMTRLLIETDLPTLLLRDADALGMSHSLAVRTPFLDTRAVEFAFTIPPRFKLHGQKEKILLRKAAKNLLPDEVANRPKQGFFAPVGYWIRDELKSVMDMALSPETTHKRRLFKPEAINTLYQRFLNDNTEPFFKIWTLAVLELWQQRFIDLHPDQSVLDPGHPTQSS